MDRKRYDTRRKNWFSANYRDDGKKRCRDCERWLDPRQDFHKNKRSPDGLSIYCKPCSVARVLSYRDKQKASESHRERKYGLSPKQYKKMLKRQKGRCAICRGEGTSRGLFVDHCHKTGKVRGLLCYHCNTALGMIHDSPKIAKRIISYLAA